jgi:hypothetical protein
MRESIQRIILIAAVLALVTPTFAQFNPGPNPIIGTVGARTLSSGTGTINAGGAISITTNGVALTMTGTSHSDLQWHDPMYPILRDIFYVVTKENPQTKQVTNVLVWRGKELHRPESMMLNRQSILCRAGGSGFRDRKVHRRAEEAVQLSCKHGFQRASSAGVR